MFIKERLPSICLKVLLLTFIHSGLFAQSPKPKSKNAKSTTGTGLSMGKSSCCIQEDNASDGLSTDGIFKEQAGSADFGKLHEEPLPFTLANPIGSDIIFNCIDGTPGRAYFIKAANPTKNYLIVIQEWWGLNDHIKQEAEKFYGSLNNDVNVIAVDLYDGKVANTVDSAQKYIMEALGSKRKEVVLQGAMDFAGKDANIYTIGWCFGGMMSLQTAINGGKNVKGCVMYYGQPEKDDARINKIQCDVLGIFGTKDRGIPNEAVDEFAGKMKKSGKNFELVRYDAVHAFANPSNPGYNKEFGDDAYGKSVAFLKARLK
jgi:carboxymethylenebutenolidase